MSVKVSIRDEKKEDEKAVEEFIHRFKDLLFSQTHNPLREAEFRRELSDLLRKYELDFSQRLLLQKMVMNVSTTRERKMREFQHFREDECGVWFLC